MSNQHALRAVLADAQAETGRPLADLQGMARDPYRLDTPANRRAAEWLASFIDPGVSTIHLRGLHYKLVSVGATKPDGERYRNTDDDWYWMTTKAAKAARWLGYVPFDRIHDAKNAEPTIRWAERFSLEPSFSVPADLPEPDADLTPHLYTFFDYAQAYRLVIFGEKSSLSSVVAPIADRFGADVYLSGGNISDTLLYKMAKTGAADDRPTVVLTLSDCDPSGWGMPSEIAHKLRAFRDSLFPAWEFEVRRVALSPDHVREHDLPSDPLKDTEKRGPAWVKQMGVEQTEIDAVLALMPDLLERLLVEAIEPFYDRSLRMRVDDASRAWRREAMEVLTEKVGIDPADAATDAEEALDRLRGTLDDMQLALSRNRELLPPIVVPGPEVPGPDDDPLTSSEWSFVEHVDALRDDRL